MSSIISFTKMTGHSVVASCLPGSRLNGTDLSGVVLGGNERPTKAPEVGAAAAQAQAYAFAAAAAGAGAGHKQTRHHMMWAFRGLEPWRDPA